MSEKRRNKSKKRNAILDAAITGFRDDGYENVSMDRIAELAGASKRTVYNHFESKESLFQAVVERFMDEVSALKNIPYDPNRSLEEQLKAFADAKVKAMANPTWQGLLKVAMGVFIRDPKLAKRTMKKAEADKDKFITWLKAARKDKRLKFKNPDLVAEIFWSLVSGALFWPALFHGPLPKKHIKVLRNEIVKTFLSRYQTG